jgi:hypothetical protein
MFLFQDMMETRLMKVDNSLFSKFGFFFIKEMNDNFYSTLTTIRLITKEEGRIFYIEEIIKSLYILAKQQFSYFKDVQSFPGQNTKFGFKILQMATLPNIFGIFNR